MPYIKVFVQDIPEFIFIYRKILPEYLNNIRGIYGNFKVDQYSYKSGKKISIISKFETFEKFPLSDRPIESYSTLCVSKKDRKSIFILIPISYNIDQQKIEIGKHHYTSLFNDVIFNFK